MPNLHPSIDSGIAKGVSGFPGGTLFCKCSADQVVVEVSGDVAHNHACGCSKCWKPEGALFSVVGVVPVDKLKVTAHGEKAECRLRLGDDPASRLHGLRGAHVRSHRDGPSVQRASTSSTSSCRTRPVGKSRDSRRSSPRSSSRASSPAEWMVFAARSSRPASTPTIAWRPR